MRAFGHKRGGGLPIVLVVHDDGSVIVWPAKDIKEAKKLAKDIEAGQLPTSVVVLQPGCDDDGNDMWEGPA